MEESEIKSEPQNEGDNYVLNSPPESTETVDKILEPQENAATSPRKKPKMEIELDFGLVKSEYVPRKRKAVNRYDLTLLLEAEERRKKQDDADYNSSKKIKVKDEKEDLYCKLCNEWFTEIQEIKHHRRTKHPNISIYTCALCSTTFASNKDLVKHKIVHVDEKRNFLCMKCKVAFSDHLEYLKHKAKHQKSVNFYCIECGKEFGNRTGYFLHIDSHYYKMVNCEVCKRECFVHKIKDHMKTHNETEHKHKETQGNKKPCVECGKVYGKTEMRLHMSSHTGVKLFQCLYCGKGCSTSLSRKIHTRIHTNEKPYKCDECDKQFRQQVDLKRHIMKNHATTKLQRFHCEVCKKEFKQENSLKYHMDIHNKTQRYTCEVCGFKVNTSTGLRSHVLRKHTKKKMFDCVPCGLAFKTGTDLHKHTKNIKHLNNVYGYKKKFMS